MKTHFKYCRKESKGTPIYRLPKYGRWRPTQQESLLLVDSQVDRPTVRFPTVVPPVDRPVDRGLDTESRALCRSTAAGRPANGQISDRCATGRPGGRPRPGYREQSSLPVDRPVDRATGPPAKWPVHVCAHRLTRPVDRLLPRSNCPVNRQKARSQILGI